VWQRETREGSTKVHRQVNRAANHHAAGRSTPDSHDRRSGHSHALATFSATDAATDAATHALATAAEIRRLRYRSLGVDETRSRAVWKELDIVCTGLDLL
jgi:hypothetical protein